MLSMASEEWVNTIVASYIEPTQKWAEHGAPVRRETADIVADGKPREQRMMLGFVTWVKQAGRVAGVARRFEIGRGSCRGRVWPYVWISVVGGSLKKKKKRDNT